MQSLWSNFTHFSLNHWTHSSRELFLIIQDLVFIIYLIIPNHITLSAQYFLFASLYVLFSPSIFLLLPIGTIYMSFQCNLTVITNPLLHHQYLCTIEYSELSNAVIKLWSNWSRCGCGARWKIPKNNNRPAKLRCAKIHQQSVFSDLSTSLLNSPILTNSAWKPCPHHRPLPPSQITDVLTGALVLTQFSLLNFFSLTFCQSKRGMF